MALENILPTQILLCLIIWHEFKHLLNLPYFGFIFDAFLLTCLYLKLREWYAKRVLLPAI